MIASDHSKEKLPVSTICMFPLLVMKQCGVHLSWLLQKQQMQRVLHYKVKTAKHVLCHMHLPHKCIPVFIFAWFLNCSLLHGREFNLIDIQLELELSDSGRFESLNYTAL